ncbi:MAG TPA: YraN family protein [Firmicutes bacterium]|nr:YraN family protein [Bacillota bacterium]
MAGKMALEVGARGEEAVVAHLESCGYKVLCRNYRTRRGEIDIVALDGDTLVFLEVKATAAGGATDPFERVNREKRRRIVMAARHYLAAMGGAGAACRFDAAVVQLDRENAPQAVTIVRDSFSLDRMRGAF